MPDTNDEYAGQGGSYIIDPATGKRQLVERTSPPEIPAPVADHSNPEKQGE